MEEGSEGKGGGNQANEQPNLGSVLAVISKTIHSMDDLEKLNNLQTKNGTSTNKRYIC